MWKRYGISSTQTLMWKQLQQGLIELGKGEEDRLRKVFDRLDRNGDGVIDIHDLRGAMAAFKHEPKKGELEDMIWEVDESMDKTVSFLEFSLMYRRVRSDKTGLEPRKLFNVVDFMMNDTNGNGLVAIDEAIQLMFMRYGKAFDENEIKRLFSTDNGNSIGFTEFLGHSPATGTDYVEKQHEAIERQKEEERLKGVSRNPKKKGAD